MLCAAITSFHHDYHRPRHNFGLLDSPSIRYCARYALCLLGLPQPLSTFFPSSLPLPRPQTCWSDVRTSKKFHMVHNKSLADMHRYWYECYHDVFRSGQYTAVIIDLHKKHGTHHPQTFKFADKLTVLGPIIRINPDELHVSDPSFIDTLYPSTGKKREISPYFFRPFAFEGVRGDLHNPPGLPILI